MLTLQLPLLPHSLGCLCVRWWDLQLLQLKRLVIRRCLPSGTQPKAQCLLWNVMCNQLPVLGIANQKGHRHSWFLPSSRFPLIRADKSLPWLWFWQGSSVSKLWKFKGSSSLTFWTQTNELMVKISSYHALRLQFDSPGYPGREHEWHSRHLQEHLPSRIPTNWPRVGYHLAVLWL